MSCVNSLVFAQSETHRLVCLKLNTDDGSELPTRAENLKSYLLNFL